MNKIVDVAGYEFMVLEDVPYGVRLISKKNVFEDVIYSIDNSVRYENSCVKKWCDDFARLIESHIGSENLINDIVRNKTVSGDGCGIIRAKARPLSFDEFRQYKNKIDNGREESFWLCSPSYQEAGTKKVAVVKNSYELCSNEITKLSGVRPVIVVSRNVLRGI